MCTHDAGKEQKTAPNASKKAVGKNKGKRSVSSKKGDAGDKPPSSAENHNAK